MKTSTKTILLALLGAANAFSQGTILWDESVDGTFSQSSSTPTSLSPFQLGTNSVLGTAEIEPTGNNWLVHEDFFTVQVPSGLFVSRVGLTTDGPQVGIWIGNPAFSSELAFAQNSTSGELLSQWGLNSILVGTYGVDIANHNAQPFTSIANYRLDFFVQTIPEPSAVSLLLVGAGLVGLRCWRKKHPSQN